MTRALALALCLAAAPLAAQVEIDNDWVRVVRVKQGPHEKIRSGEYESSVSIYLTDGHVRLTDWRGKTREISHRAGDAAYNSAREQTEENLSARPLEFVVIGLKQGPAKTAPVELDPVKLDPEHHLVLRENDRVRVLRTILEPHVKAPMHQHPHYVVVYLTDLHTAMRMGDGRLVDNVRRAGEIGWRDALKHATENLGERTAVEIQVELK